jgi:hypothetical protein
MELTDPARQRLLESLAIETEEEIVAAYESSVKKLVECRLDEG